MHTYSATSAFTIAGMTGGALLGVVFVIWKSIGITPQMYPFLFLATLLFSIALISVSVYQALRIYESAHTLAQGITKEMIIHSRELFAELYRNSPVPYLLIDTTGVVESANFSAARLFNIEVSELEGVDIFRAIEGDDEQKMSLIPEYFKEGRFVNDIESHIKRSDGLIRYVMLSLFSFTDPDGRRKGLMTLVDITKQKQVDKAKTEFVSLASHQLRTPVSAMRWNLELLTTMGGDTLNDIQKGYVQKLSNSLERMGALVDDFLNVSKLELGTLAVKRSTFNLKQFFELILDEYRAYATERGVTLETNWDAEMGEYDSDSHLLNMAVSNLLGNAIKYTPQGGTARAYAEMRGDAFVITIADTGIGIPVADQDMIFSKLFRASNAQEHGVEGTGLGLYVVKEAIRLLGGTISFESTEGKGTTFTVVLPK